MVLLDHPVLQLTSDPKAKLDPNHLLTSDPQQWEDLHDHLAPLLISDPKPLLDLVMSDPPHLVPISDLQECLIHLAHQMKSDPLEWGDLPGAPDPLVQLGHLECLVTLVRLQGGVVHLYFLFPWDLQG